MGWEFPPCTVPTVIRYYSWNKKVFTAMSYCLLERKANLLMKMWLILL